MARYIVRRPFTNVAILAVTLVTLPRLSGQSGSPFTFTKIDLKLLEECDALDRQLENRALVHHDAGLEKYLAGLAAGMLPDAPLEHVVWKFHILRDPMVNAMALPNGSIYVDSGLLARAESDEQVAGVLAHEITHVTNRHTYLFNRSLRKKTVAAEVIALATWIPAGGAASVVAAAAAGIGQTAILATIYGYGRKIEEEADRTGIDRMSRAGRDPAQLVRLFEILDDKLEPEPVPLFHDHPTIKDRIAYLTKLVDTAPHAAADAAYVPRLRAVIQQNVQLDLESRRFRSALAGAERLAAAFPDEAAVVSQVAECYRSLGPRAPRLSRRQLTDDGMNAAYKQTVKRTEEDDTRMLAATPEGRAAVETNQRKAEELFRKAAAMDPGLADPYFGLGALYEQQNKIDAAESAYRKYVALSTSMAAKERGERRIETLKQGAGKGGAQ
jgi:predicted Zn-dependent protease